VETPIRLLRIVIAAGLPSFPRNTSKTENGRRKSGSAPLFAFNITNCPGVADAAIAGAASASTL
jgi:hypothetical protein